MTRPTHIAPLIAALLMLGYPLSYGIFLSAAVRWPEMVAPFWGIYKPMGPIVRNAIHEFWWRVDPAVELEPH